VLHLQHQHLAHAARAALIGPRQARDLGGFRRRQELRVHVLGGGEIHLRQALEPGRGAAGGLWGSDMEAVWTRGTTDSVVGD
jgi:hypothetical protein